MAARKVEKPGKKKSEPEKKKSETKEMRSETKGTRSGFDHKYPILGVLIVIIAAAGIILIWMGMPRFSDNVAAEFGPYTSNIGYGNSYFAGACSEGDFVTSFYTMSGISGRLTKIVVPVEVYDDPDAQVVADVKICEAELGGGCIGDEVNVVSGFGFGPNDNWGTESGDKELDLRTPFYVNAGSYYKITIDGNMNRNIVYSMYKADVPAGVNRYSHSANGCSSSRTDVYVIYFWAV